MKTLLTFLALLLFVVPAQAATSPYTLMWQRTKWNVFYRTGNLYQNWNPNRVEIDASTGRLLETAMYSSAGGVGNPAQYLYGHWVSRIRMSPALGSKYVMLLIDKPGGAEIDFAENRGKDLDPNRTELTATIHFADGIKPIALRNSVRVDMTKFHQVALWWSPGLITFRVDGRTWWEVATTRLNGISMHPTIQTNKYGPGPKSVLEVSYFRYTALSNQ